MTSPGEGTRETSEMVVHNAEIQAELKDRLRDYARDNGLSQAAATRILLGDALTRAGYPREDR